MSATVSGDHGERVDAPPRRPRLPTRLLRLASDERLVELLRGGSAAAFEVLYARHHRGILSFCRHMLGSVEEAEDAVQHTFLAAYRDIIGSRKAINVRPWLYAIARNRCLTVLRARRSGEAPCDAEPSTEQLSVEVERRHELRALLGDLARLPDDQRAALVLAELGDMSHDEIGQALDCPREKVKALVFQARSSLIASREAREAPCADIRAQLATLRGGALRRNVLRRHLRECAGCREFRDQVATQRGALALILPVAPSVGLHAAVTGGMGATAAGGGAAAAGAGVAAAGGTSVSTVVATATVVLAVAGGGTVAVEATRDGREPPVPEPPRPAAVAPAVAAEQESQPAVRRTPAQSPRPAGKPRPVSTPDDRGEPTNRRARSRRPQRGLAPSAAAAPQRAARAEQVASPPEAARGDRPPSGAPRGGPPSGVPRGGPPSGVPRGGPPEHARGGKPEQAGGPQLEKPLKPETAKGPKPLPVTPPIVSGAPLPAEAEDDDSDDDEQDDD